jgi:hypothetical protein
MTLRKRRTRVPAPQDLGLQQIDEWLKCFTAFNAERLRAWPDGDLLDAERAKVAALGAATVAALRAQYLARQPR